MSWRIPAWCQCIGPVLTLILTSSMPESPRVSINLYVLILLYILTPLKWLVKRGRKEEARRVLVKYHANGYEYDALVAREFREICIAIEEEKNTKQISYLDFFRTPGNRHRLWILIVQGKFFRNISSSKVVFNS